jgi:uncharacterized membrane protein
METLNTLSIDELKSKREAILRDLTKKENPSILNRMAVWITNKVGTMGFFLCIFTWTVGWLGWNTLGPKAARFDPFPGFVLWLFISNMIQLFLMPLIMLGQNIQSKHTDIRAEVDLKINTHAELENETILLHLEYQNKMILEILENINSKTKPQ